MEYKNKNNYSRREIMDNAIYVLLLKLKLTHFQLRESIEQSPCFPLVSCKKFLYPKYSLSLSVVGILCDCGLMKVSVSVNIVHKWANIDFSQYFPCCFLFFFLFLSDKSNQKLVHRCAVFCRSLAFNPEATKTTTTPGTSMHCTIQQGLAEYSGN